MLIQNIGHNIQNKLKYKFHSIIILIYLYICYYVLVYYYSYYIYNYFENQTNNK